MRFREHPEQLKNLKEAKWNGIKDASEEYLGAIKTAKTK
jgi:hypothetical protein